MSISAMNTYRHTPVKVEGGFPSPSVPQCADGGELLRQNMSQIGMPHMPSIDLTDHTPDPGATPTDNLRQILAAIAAKTGVNNPGYKGFADGGGIHHGHPVGAQARNAAAAKTYHNRLADAPSQLHSQPITPGPAAIPHGPVPSVSAGPHVPDGRMDNVLTQIPKGGFVVPADVVSKIGRGSSAAGHEILAQANAPHMQAPHGMADGGGATHEMAPVRLSRDEHVMHPDWVRAIGGGNSAAGAARAYHWRDMIRGMK